MTRIVGDRRDRLRAMLADLKMPGALEAGRRHPARRRGWRRSDHLRERRSSGSLAAQIALRNSRRLATAMRSSTSSGDQDAHGLRLQPSSRSVKREQIDSSSRARLPGTRKENVDVA